MAITVGDTVRALSSETLSDLPMNRFRDSKVVNEKRISIMISKDLLSGIDQLIGSGDSRSAFIEKVLKDHIQELERQAIHQRDFELINANADYLNREMKDVLRYQADIFEDWAPRQ